ncbi:MAG: hypothetical protein ACRYFU_23965 [Janthinobacterium lividum]
MPSQISILLYGRDFQLLEIRQWVLERAGYRVVAVTELHEITQLLCKEISLFILCHTLSMEECGRALALFHTQWPQVQTINLIAGQMGCRPDYSSKLLDAREGPVKLLNAVAELVCSEPAMSLASHQPL